MAKSSNIQFSKANTLLRLALNKDRTYP